ncbi:hypothetical protein M0R45_016507 [Rubus argutus]|uniref:Uncharacterized protein n=1 Tax=Rubus argutus TaxID=59490 RepID=A0AAW1XV95_RUBAR
MPETVTAALSSGLALQFVLATYKPNIRVDEAADVAALEALFHASLYDEFKGGDMHGNLHSYICMQIRIHSQLRRENTKLRDALYTASNTGVNAIVDNCIHNIAYQGRFAFADFSLLNLPAKAKSYGIANTKSSSASLHSTMAYIVLDRECLEISCHRYPMGCNSSVLGG